MTTATGQRGEGASQLPFYPQLSRESLPTVLQRYLDRPNEVLDANTVKPKAIDEIPRRPMRVEEPRRYMGFAMRLRASFGPVHNGHGIHESYIQRERVQRVAATTAEPDYGYDFEYDPNPCACLELEKRVGDWLRDPAFTCERQYAKELCRQTREWDSHSRLTTLSNSIRVGNEPATRGGRTVIGIGRTRCTYGIWSPCQCDAIQENMTSGAQDVQSYVDSAGCYWLQTPLITIRQAEVLHQTG